MFDFQDLFQWDRFITPTIIKTFYWLVIGLIILFGISGIFSGLAAMAISPFGGFILLLSSIAGVVVGIVFSRIAAEFILIVFRINEHLGAIRDQGQMRGVCHSGARESANLRCAIAHRGISRFRVRCFASPRNDGSNNQVLNRKCITSPSATTYSLPSSRSLPPSRAPASPPSAT
jgi:predicted membrane metal-binding protein